MLVNSVIRQVSVETANEQVMFGMNGELGCVASGQDKCLLFRNFSFGGTLSFGKTFGLEQMTLTVACQTAREEFF